MLELVGGVERRVRVDMDGRPLEVLVQAIACAWLGCLEYACVGLSGSAG